MLRSLLRLVGIRTPIELVSARMVTDESHNYFVSFTEHHPQLQRPECIRLVLHYYAKILYNFSPSEPAMLQSAQILQTTMRSVADANIYKGADVLLLAELSDVARIVHQPPTKNSRELIATLYFKSTAERHISTKFPRNTYAQHLVISVFVLLQAALDEMDPACITVLKRALTRMNEYYESGESFSSLTNLARIPTESYLEGVMD